MKKKAKIIDFQKAQEQEKKEQQFRKEKAEAAPIWRALGIAGIAAVVLYFSGNVASYLLNPLTTTVAYQYVSYDSIDVAGIICREEQVLSDAGGLFYIDREEGERVSKGGNIATVYQNEDALYLAEELSRLKLQLSQLEYAKSITSGSQEILKLDDTVKDTMVSLKSALIHEDYKTFRQSSSTLKTLILKQDYTYSGEVNVEEQINLLRAEIAEKSTVSRNVSQYIKAPVGGIYSMLVDGYETVLTPEKLTSLTPSAFLSLQPDGTVASNVGKLITGDVWYYATVMEKEDAPYVGQDVTVRFQSGFSQEIPMEAVSVSHEENGRCLVVLETNQYLSSTTLLRDQTGEVILSTVEGIRVPKSALRLEEKTIETEDGESKTYMQSGVYCLLGRYARFKPVEILLEEQDYYLVRAVPEVLGYTTQTKISLYTLRHGDTVIMSGNDLYDGKVVS